MFKPTWYAKDINSIEIDILKANKIDTILCDLDNTLVAFNQKTPLKETLDFINKLNKQKIKLYLISNNNQSRVDLFNKDLKLICLHDAKKPFKANIVNFIKENKIDTNKAVFIGDQLLTDIWLANVLNIKSVLVEPVAKKDLLITRFNRFIDSIIRNYNLKRNKYSYISREGK